MKQKRHTEDQIVQILRIVEKKSKPIAEAIREFGVSEQTYFRWKRKYGGMGISEAKRLKELERENARLKRALADAVLAAEVLKEVNAKKW